MSLVCWVVEGPLAIAIKAFPLEVELEEMEKASWR